MAATRSDGGGAGLLWDLSTPLGGVTVAPVGVGSTPMGARGTYVGAGSTPMGAGGTPVVNRSSCFTASRGRKRPLPGLQLKYFFPSNIPSDP